MASMTDHKKTATIVGRLKERNIVKINHIAMPGEDIVREHIEAGRWVVTEDQDGAAYTFSRGERFWDIAMQETIEYHQWCETEDGAKINAHYMECEYWIHTGNEPKVLVDRNAVPRSMYGTAVWYKGRTFYLFSQYPISDAVYQIRTALVNSGMEDIGLEDDLHFANTLKDFGKDIPFLQGKWTPEMYWGAIRYLAWALADQTKHGHTEKLDKRVLRRIMKDFARDDDLMKWAGDEEDD